MSRPRPTRALGAALAVALVLALAALAPAAPGSARSPEAGPAAVKPPNPCLDPERRRYLRCPDLIMKRPFGLYLDRATRPGRTLLRAGNSIDNVGLGPAELHGVRTGRLFMRGRQRIRRRYRSTRLGVDTGARLFFKYVRGQTRYWKFHRAAAFQLWRLDREGERVRRVRNGPKVSYCLRDLERSRPGRRGSPRRRVYPACSTNPAQRRVTIGTSVGWSDVYPETYPEQWIDVTGLRGCFLYRHIADPRNGVFESNEDNNVAGVVVRLPYRYGRQRCPGGGYIPRSEHEGHDHTYGY